MKKLRVGIFVRSVLIIALCIWIQQSATLAEYSQTSSVRDSGGFAGSQSCRKCHEKFYELWAPSHHGLAMQPYSEKFALKNLSQQTYDITIEGYQYFAETTGENAWVVEKGVDGVRKYHIDHVMGGKNVYYFLTLLERGRLQTLPLAYDTRKKEWFDMAKSGVRHFSNLNDEPVNWKEWPYTFNTSCYGCHVSQISTNYDPRNDSYNTVWKEPGINCETCHGPAQEHIRVCEETPKGTIPKDLRLKRGGRDFTHEQNNATCSTCHAKAIALSNDFKPGDRFFDHFDLVTLENPDYYPDGRDLGENYTYTTWIMSPCVKSGRIDCLHCHTSSGRYKFKTPDMANGACLPCHTGKVEAPDQHTHHKKGSSGARCVACHMPSTDFARMRRTDHSMLPPTPSATIEFKSPNACNICHEDKSPQWADAHVSKWRDWNYQGPVLKRAGLINDARKRHWTRLDEMLAYLDSDLHDTVYANSLIRLLRTCEDSRKWPAIFRSLKDPSPLVRSSAAETLAQNQSPDTVKALIEATDDDFLLVRIRAAAALASFPTKLVQGQDLTRVRKATQEYIDSLMARPDHWSSHYNLGNFFLNKGRLQPALAAFETSSKLDPLGVTPLVNLSIAYARAGSIEKAEDSLERALKIDPKNSAAHFNMGLLKAEIKDLGAAEKHLKTALELDPNLGEAAYNLSVILAGNRLDEALEFIKKASQIRPTEARYAYTLAFYHFQQKDFNESIKVLKKLTLDNPAYVNSYLLLGEIYEIQGRRKEAADTLHEALKNPSITGPAREALQARIKRFTSQ